MEKKTLSFRCKEDWKIKKLGAISHSFSGGTPSVCVKNYYGGNIPFIKSGEIHRSETEQFLTEEGLCNSAAKLVDKGTILYALYGATSGEVDIAKLSGAINQAILAIIPNRNVDKYFLKEQLLYKKQYIVNTFLQGGQGNLSSAIVNNINISLPSFPEQQSIGTYFRTLDNKIQTTSKKLASLKKLKSASLVALFPQNGESKPKVRFKGFEGEWSKEILGNIAKFSKGQGYSKSDLREDGHPIILYGRMYTKYQFTINNVDTFAYLKEASVFSEGNEIIMPASGETPEDIARASAVLKKGIILGGDLNIMHFDLKKHSTPFIALAITYSNTHYDLSKCAQGKSVVHLHNEAISKATITLPSYEEQQAIASFFRTLNRKIALETARLEKLKQIKLACLDKMFV